MLLLSYKKKFIVDGRWFINPNIKFLVLKEVCDFFDLKVV